MSQYGGLSCNSEPRCRPTTASPRARAATIRLADGRRRCSVRRHHGLSSQTPGDKSSWLTAKCLCQGQRWSFQHHQFGAYLEDLPSVQDICAAIFRSGGHPAPAKQSDCVIASWTESGVLLSRCAKSVSHWSRLWPRRRRRTLPFHLPKLRPTPPSSLVPPFGFSHLRRPGARHSLRLEHRLSSRRSLLLPSPPARRHRGLVCQPHADCCCLHRLASGLVEP
jgi:hypothetical protein